MKGEGESEGGGLVPPPPPPHPPPHPTPTHVRAQAMGCDISLLATDWFLCLFCTSLPAETVLRVWDALMHEGAKVRGGGRGVGGEGGGGCGGAACAGRRVRAEPVPAAQN